MAPWALHLGLALLVTAPGALTAGSRMVGDPRVDVWNHAWGPWWFWDSLVHGRLPLATHLLNAPEGGRLWFIDPVGAAAGMWLVPLGGAVLAWNAVILVLVVAASVAGRQLASTFGAGERASWIGAVGVAASAHVISELHNGISEAVGVAWGVFALSALVRATATPAPLRGWVQAGLLGGLTALGTYYYALGLGLAAVVVVGEGLWRGPRRQVVRGVLVAAVVAAAMTVPVLLVVESTLADVAHSIIQRDAADWRDRFWVLQHNAVDPLSLVVPGDFQSVDLTSLGESFRHSSYLGFCCLIPAIRSPQRRLLWAAAVPLVFSLGPFLWVGGDWVRLGGQLVALPYRLLMDLFPSGAIAHPQRVGFIGIAIVAAVGAAGVAERHARWVVGALLVELLLLSPAPWPLARTPALDFGYAEAIQAAVRETPNAVPRAVVDVPAHGEGMSTSRYLVFQTVHGQPIPYGPNVRADAFRMFGNPGLAGLVLGNGTAFRQARVEDLRRGDAGFIALHRDLGETAEMESWLRDKLGEPNEHGPVLFWDVRPTDRGTPIPRANAAAGPPNSASPTAD